MFQAWRLPLREAEEAFEQGRLDQASRLIGQHRLHQYLAGSQLAVRIANRLAERARECLSEGDLSAGWRNWQAAHDLMGSTDQLRSMRQALLQGELTQVESQLAAEHFGGARSHLEILQRRGVSEERLRTLEEVTRRLETASQLARQGQFVEAESHVASAAALLPDWGFLGERRAELQRRKVRSRELSEQLHRAILADDWRQAFALSEKLLDLAPDYSVAQDARRRAWKMVNSRRAAAGQRGETQGELAPSEKRNYPRTAVLAAQRPPHASTKVVDETHYHDHESKVAPAAQGNAPRQFSLWVDGVGGYLVCMDDEVVLGQASPENLTGPQRVHVAIRGDLSRRHAIIHRRGEAYTLEPLAPVRINGRPVQSCTLLSDRAEIVLGESTRLRFRQPHPLSATARLEFLSRHRSQPYSDAVLLMGESCVLGPGERSHVVCRDWPQDLVLYREGHALGCRTGQPIEIDGRTCNGHGRVTRTSRIVGDNFSVTLEEV